MGSAARSVGHAVGGAVSKAVKTVGNVTKPVTNGIGKIAQGKVAEGVGDITQTAARTGLDIATGGNKKIVDAYSGGFLTSAEQAARGNTKDAARLGLVGGAAVVGGPGAAYATNMALANGASPILAGASILGAGNFGGNMSLISDVGSFINSNKDLIGQVVDFGNKPKAAPQPSYAPAAIPQPIYQPDNTKMLLMAGGGFLGLILVLVLVLRSKGK
jgi:hypothetical protein